MKIGKSGHDAEEPEIKQRDRIRARCWGTQNKNEGLEFKNNAGELETK